MKLHLPKLLRVALLSVVCTASAAVVEPARIITSGTISSDSANPGVYQVVVKDGEGIASVAANTTKYSALYVREGTLLVGDGVNAITLTVNPSAGSLGNANLVLIQISGSNAEMEVNKATITSGHESWHVIGGADGNGTLTLKNGACVSTGNVGYTMIGSTKAHETSFGNATSGEESDTRYEGTYTEAANGSGELFGKGVVNVNSQSTLRTGMYGLIMSEGDLNVNGTGASVIVGQRYTRATYLGYDADSTSTINVTNGASMQVNASMYTGISEGATSIINVGGYGEDGVTPSVFSVAATSSMASGDFPNSLQNQFVYTMLGVYSSITSDTYINVKNGGVVRLNGISQFGAMGGKSKVEVNILEGGKLEVKGPFSYYANHTYDSSAGVSYTPYISMNDNTSINNAGTMDLDRLHVAGGSVDNSGDAIIRSLKVDGGSVSNTGTLGASSCDLVMSGGSILNSGDAAFSYMSISETSAFTNTGSIESPNWIWVYQGGTLNLDASAGNAKTSYLITYDTGSTIRCVVGGESAGNAAPITITDGGMVSLGSDATFALLMTEDYLSDIQTVQTNVNVKVIDGDLSYADNSYSSALVVEGVDSMFWSVDTPYWSSNEAGVYVNTVLTRKQDVVIESGSDVAADITDINDDEAVSVTVTGDASLSGDNSYTGGTTIIDAGVTLGSPSALGAGGIETEGVSSISTADNVTVGVGATIQNSGQLTLNGSYDATALAVTLDETHVDVDGATGDNGFVRDSGSIVQLVKNHGEEATLTVGDDFKLGVGEEEYALDTATGVAMIGAAIHYDTYYIADADHSVAVDQIQAASGGQTDKIVMSSGSLLVNENISVEVTGGALSVASGKEVTGSIENAVVTGDNGTVSADLKGGVTLKGGLSLSGAGSTTGVLALDGAAVTLGSAMALGNAAVSSSGTSSLSASGEEPVTMTQVISNAGTLTLSGRYDVSLLAAETIESAYVDAEGNVTADGNGFLRYEGCSVAVVDNAAEGASVIQGDNFQVLKGNATGTLDSATGVATFGAGIDYSVYHMVESDEQGKTVSDILGAETADAMVYMSTGKLTADADVQLNATGGELVTEGGTVSGSIADTSITANGGEIAADISGDSAVTVTGDTTISGENTSGAGINVNSAALVLGSSSALGNGDVATSGNSMLSTDGDITADVKGELAVNDGSLTMSGNFNIAGAVENKGELSMDGNIATTGKITNDGTLNLAGGNAISQTIANNGLLNLNGTVDASGIEKDAVGETFIDVGGQIGSNGFKRDEGSSFQLASNGADATIGTGEDLVVTHNGTQYEFDSSTGIAYAHGQTHYGTYFITEADHSVEVSEIQKISDNQTIRVVMSDGTLTTDDTMDVETTGGNLNTENGTVTGSIADTSITTDGGEIAAAISGESSVTVTGETSLSGDNSYTGDTVIAGEGARLTVAAGSSLGTGKVLLDDHGTLDLGGNAIANEIVVTGCTLAGAGAYSGNLTVSGNLMLQDATTAKSVTMTGKGRIAGADLTTDKLEVATSENATIGGSLTINDNGTLTLNDGKVLSVGGSLTLGNGASLVLNGDYAAGDKLLTSESGALTMGDVTLVYDDSTVELEVQDGSLVLVTVSDITPAEPVLVFDQPMADALVLSNWASMSASRAFVDAVQGQRSNTGCIANGRGTAWAAVLGTTNELGSGDISLLGAAVGADMKVGRNSSIGVAVGCVDGDAEPAVFRKVEQENTYVALYGEHGLKKLSNTSCLSMGWTATYGQSESELGNRSWEQQSVQLDTRLNWSKKVSQRLSVSVFGGLEYFANESDRVGGVKTGSIQNLRGEAGVGARYVAWGSPTISDGKMGLVQPGCEKLVLHGEVRYMNDMVRSNPVVRMNGMSGMGENPGRQGVGIEAGATYRIGERWSVSANYGFNTMEDSKEHRVNVGASYTF